VDAAQARPIVQTGTQAVPASGHGLMEFLHAGGIGEVKLPRIMLQAAGSIGLRGNISPRSVNYDVVRPAPLHTLTRPTPLRLALAVGHGNGDPGNQGIHQMDLARWGLNVHDLGQGSSAMADAQLRGRR
jgi:hypothetical protein